MANQSTSEPNFGLDSTAIDLIKTIFSSELGLKKYRVFVFGSRSMGKHKKYSDLDLWIESDPPLTELELANLRERFESSDLAIKVDLLTPQTCLEDYRDRIKSQLVRLI